jgi:predicted dehydrogenase
LARNHGFGGNWVYAQDPNIPFEHSKEEAPLGQDECPPWIPEQLKGPYLGYLQQWTHNINLLRFLLDDKGGAKVASVQLDPDGMTGVVVMEMNGTRAVVESAYMKYHAWEEHTQIYFEGGWLRTEAPH